MGRKLISEHVDEAYQLYKADLIHMDQFASLVTAIQSHATKIAEAERHLAAYDIEIRESAEYLEDLMKRWSS